MPLTGLKGLTVPSSLERPEPGVLSEPALRFDPPFIRVSLLSSGKERDCLFLVDTGAQRTLFLNRAKADQWGLFQSPFTFPYCCYCCCFVHVRGVEGWRVNRLRFIHAERILLGDIPVSREPMAFLEIPWITTDLGVRWCGIRSPAGDLHVVVNEVLPDGPADRAGLKPGDELQKIDGQPVQSLQDLSKAMASRKPGDTLRLLVSRAGTSRECIVTAGTSPTLEIDGILGADICRTLSVLFDARGRQLRILRPNGIRDRLTELYPTHAIVTAPLHWERMGPSVDVMNKGQVIRMIVDTGASASFLPKAKIQALELVDMHCERGGEGASGTVIFPTYWLEGGKLGSWSFSSLMGALPDMAVLGYDVLGRIPFVVDGPGDLLWLAIPPQEQE